MLPKPSQPSGGQSQPKLRHSDFEIARESIQWRDTNKYNLTSYTHCADHDCGQHRMEILQRAKRQADILNRRCRQSDALLRFPCER